MIHSEYLRFLPTLIAKDIPAEVRKVANLVLSNLDTLIPLSTAQGQRIKEIVKLTQTNCATVLSENREYRDSLMFARRALESLTERTWYHYGKHCDKADGLFSEPDYESWRAA
jgi:hypothetical protein